MQQQFLSLLCGIALVSIAPTTTALPQLGDAIIKPPVLEGVDLSKYANYPAVFPSIDQTFTIDDDLLEAPLVTEAYKLVQSKVPASILNIKPSKYNPRTPSNPEYNDDATANCYWPQTQCIAPKELSTCPAGTWGVTFDDGPTVHAQYGTRQVREALARLDISATFFCAGANAFQNPQELRTTYLEGHELAIHTWSHHPLTALTNEQIVAELLYTQAIIYGNTGLITRFYRPPYGDIDNRVRAIADALGLVSVMWTHDSQDAGFSGPESKVVETIQSWATDGTGFISLQHDITQVTSRLAIEALAGLKEPLVVKPMAVSECSGQAAYLDAFAGAPASTTSASPTSTPTSTGGPFPPFPIDTHSPHDPDSDLPISGASSGASASIFFAFAAVVVLAFR
ncbi:chitin deacetylase [Gaertneriomyces sp. JEL0708]|nr:chitin deacetylase [Gaertneriomyces sp. JEL0708]